MDSEQARSILHTPRETGTVGPWRVGDRIETQEQAELLQSILDGDLLVTERASHPAAFRIFQLTMDVYLPSHAPLPETFADWIELAFGIDPATLGASPTTLQRVAEIRYPISRDVVKRRTRKDGPWR
jgi:hypothetical protein